MTIDIPEDQLYTLDQLADDLHRKLGWTWHEVSGDGSGEVWDIHYREIVKDEDGQTETDTEFYFMLDGAVYCDSDCTDYNGDLDYRNLIPLCELVWVCVPPEVDRHRVIGICS